jgi:hypothetical protein
VAACLVLWLGMAERAWQSLAWLWRSLLKFAVSGNPGDVRIHLPDGEHVTADDSGFDDLLPALPGCRVRSSAQRTVGAEVERLDPEDVLEHGVDADVEFARLEPSQGAPACRSSTTQPFT